ncbi:hypothetical protein O6H91_06G019200 [Diphasiastrum complanatum]|uniref:Uncharacterized protein n=1 Tax=Diphasiastrum complanatum TaxID=34168 RepID=A0ACC2DC35_DIPCM|nr:hypothetical protein O6H91_06G019200 [Diphasiastrum complanatum]
MQQICNATSGQVRESKIMTIKEQLLRADEFPPEKLLGLLLQLKNMDLGLEDLKATMVGKVVNNIKKYARDGNLRHVAKRLVDDWKKLVDNLFHPPAKQAKDCNINSCFQQISRPKATPTLPPPKEVQEKPSLQLKKTVNNSLISSAPSLSSSVAVLQKPRRPARARQMPTAPDILKNHKASQANAVAGTSIADGICKKNVWVKFNSEVIGGPIVCRIPSSWISKKADEMPAIEPKRSQKRLHTQAASSSSHEVKRGKGQSATLININKSSKPKY